MSCSYAKGAWEVRWRDSTGRQRSRRFHEEAAAKEFDEAIHDVKSEQRKSTKYGSGGGVYPYQTANGTKWRCVVKRTDGTWTSKRGFTSRTAATNWRQREIENTELGLGADARQTFGEYWTSWLDRRKPYLRQGTWAAYERDGRLRLLPALESITLDRLHAEHVQALTDQMAEAVKAGDLAPKTLDNTLTTLGTCLNAAVTDHLITTNPALRGRQTVL